jgi:hypothetical protein
VATGVAGKTGKMRGKGAESRGDVKVTTPTVTERNLLPRRWKSVEVATRANTGSNKVCAQGKGGSSSGKEESHCNGGVWNTGFQTQNREGASWQRERETKAKVITLP